MNERIDQVFVAIAAAISARRLYGSDHRAAAETSRRVHAELGHVLAEIPYLEFHFLEDRVVGPAGVVACDAASIDAIRFPLRERDAASVRFERGVSEVDLEQLLGSLDGSKVADPVDPVHIALGRTMIAPLAPGAGSECVGPPTALSIANDLRDTLLVSTAENPIEPARLEDVAGKICMALIGSRGTMLRLAGLKSHDEYTFMHTVNVALLAASLADSCGLSADQVHQITLAALMHDLGKRDIPLSILGKGGPLDERERRIMQEHPVEGARLLVGRPGVPDVAAIVAYEHHMHIDGSGYPGPVRGNRPHLASQIVQQADVYDALRTHRPYRSAMTEKEACDLLITGTASKYDRSLVETFIQRVASRIDAGPVSAEPDPPLRKAG